MADTTAALLSPKHPVHPLRGYIYIACSAVFWGMSASLGRAAFTGRLVPASNIAAIDPLILSQARTTFSFLLVGLRETSSAWFSWRGGIKLLLLSRHSAYQRGYRDHRAIHCAHLGLVVHA